MFKNKREFKHSFVQKFRHLYGKDIAAATPESVFQTLGCMVREEAAAGWIDTNRLYRERGAKQVYYFSMEFLLGRLLESNLLNLGVLELCREGLAELGLNLDKALAAEPDAGLGNGGLGRLAACFLDSLASLGLPGMGCGIRYRYGLFEQVIADGHQLEMPENWLCGGGSVWETRRPEEAVEVRFGGRVRAGQAGGRLVFHHEDYQSVLAVPYDIPVIGHRNGIVNTLRLWSAEPALEDLKRGCREPDCYRRVVEYKHRLEAISELLYPDDSSREGKVLRLQQQYFLVSAGLQSIARLHKQRYGTLKNLHERVAVHVNDTHPVLAIPELMRILIDEEEMGWEEAWSITRQTVSYTNHTTLREALETWPVEIFAPLFPRIYQIVEEIDRRFKIELGRLAPARSGELARSTAIIDGGTVKMAHLAIVGSHSVNGVSRLHTEILKRREMKEFYELYPQKFNNKTNGISHRRWLLQANPRLASLVTETVGPGWISDPSCLLRLLDYAGDASFQEAIRRVKEQNKADLARIIRERTGWEVDLQSIFDVQVKRIHAYKRQLLNALHILHLYNRLLEDPGLEMTPRTFIFGGKAFPNYLLAKRIIKLINTLAELINNDRRIGDRLKVIFLENYSVSLAEKIIPAADVSEQISTAGKEASGTGNMKFMLNGAVTIGTADGANIEIAEAVGRDNIFIFGLEAAEALRCHQQGYRAAELYAREPLVREVVDQLVNGFLPAGREEFAPIHDSLMAGNDEYLVLKDLLAYVETQKLLERAFRERSRWLKMSIVNVAHAGQFSSDRTVAAYASEIWRIAPPAAAPLQRAAGCAAAES
ncbi:MAG: glycogen/starch/alpha-glucan phosphorylase [Firmicutes bacterium]|nr:glycogen/starch/alpha-glucan phosphorylase [Bacillota bacterium]